MKILGLIPARQILSITTLVPFIYGKENSNSSYSVERSLSKLWTRFRLCLSTWQTNDILPEPRMHKGQTEKENGYIQESQPSTHSRHTFDETHRKRLINLQENFLQQSFRRLVQWALRWRRYVQVKNATLWQGQEITIHLLSFLRNQAEIRRYADSRRDSNILRNRKTIKSKSTHNERWHQTQSSRHVQRLRCPLFVSSVYSSLRQASSSSKEETRLRNMEGGRSLALYKAPYQESRRLHEISQCHSGSAIL